MNIVLGIYQDYDKLIRNFLRDYFDGIDLSHIVEITTSKDDQDRYFGKTFSEKGKCKIELSRTLFDTKKNQLEKTLYHEAYHAILYSKCYRIYGDLDKIEEFAKKIDPVLYNPILFNQSYNLWNEYYVIKETEKKFPIKNEDYDDLIDKSAKATEVYKFGKTKNEIHLYLNSDLEKAEIIAIMYTDKIYDLISEAFGVLDAETCSNTVRLTQLHDCLDNSIIKYEYKSLWNNLKNMDPIPKQDKLYDVSNFFNYLYKELEYPIRICAPCELCDLKMKCLHTRV